MDIWRRIPAKKTMEEERIYSSSFRVEPGIGRVRRGLRIVLLTLCQTSSIVASVSNTNSNIISFELKILGPDSASN